MFEPLKFNCIHDFFHTIFDLSIPTHALKNSMESEHLPQNLAPNLSRLASQAAQRNMSLSFTGVMSSEKVAFVKAQNAVIQINLHINKVLSRPLTLHSYIL